MEAAAVKRRFYVRVGSEARDGGRRRLLDGRPVTDLAVAVVAPALRLAAREERAGVGAAAGDARGATGNRGNPRLAGGGAAVSELAVAVVADALNGTGGRHDAHV